jgi:uncharacterized surface protein with fasciclin (FAS1) repeats
MHPGIRRGRSTCVKHNERRADVDAFIHHPESHMTYNMTYNMKKFVVASVLALGFGTVAQAQKMQNPMVGGQAMYADKDIVDNAVKSADHTTLVAAVKAAGLVETLKGKGPFTVFAPTNAAFSALPAGTVETLLKPENKGTLTSVLTYHVVPGRYDAQKLMQLIKKGNGTATLKTANGESLSLMMNGARNVQVKDAKGNVANIAIYDVYQSNGVILVIDKVLMP